MSARYNVAADLSVNNAGFIAGFAAAERAVRSFQGTMATAGGQMATHNAAMGASAAAMGAMGGAARQASGTYVQSNRDMQRAMSGMNTAMGVTTASLLANNRELSNVGRVGQSAAQTIDTVGRTSERAGRNMSMISREGGRAQGALYATASGATLAASELQRQSRWSSNSSRSLGDLGRAGQLAERDLDRFNRTARGFSMTAMGLAAISLGGAISSVREFASYESAFADFEKVTEATKEEFREFDLVFREMGRNLPATYEEISQTAAAASQLGVEKDAVEVFTETMIRMGTATDLSSEDAAFALSRLMNIMGTAQGDVDRFGSTLVQLGNTHAATESEIANMALRIGAMGKELNMSEAEVLALSASLTSLGIRAEMGKITHCPYVVKAA